MHIDTSVLKTSKEIKPINMIIIKYIDLQFLFVHTVYMCIILIYTFIHVYIHVCGID